MSSYNLTIVFTHKKRINIPFTHFKIRGMLFIWITIFVSLISLVLMYIFLSVFLSKSNAIIFSVATSIILFGATLVLVQSKNENTDNYNVIDLIYKFLLKTNMTKSLNTNEKVFYFKKNKRLNLIKKVSLTSWK